MAAKGLYPVSVSSFSNKNTQRELTVLVTEGLYKYCKYQYENTLLTHIEHITPLSIPEILVKLKEGYGLYRGLSISCIIGSNYGTFRLLKPFIITKEQIWKFAKNYSLVESFQKQLITEGYITHDEITNN